MKILYASPEVYPLIKTGGLGDVAGALPAALHALGEDIRIVMPAYPQVLDAVYNQAAGHVHDRKSGFALGDPFGAGEVTLFETALPGTKVPLWLVDCPALFARPGNPYLQENGEDWPDNHLRFALLSWAAAKCAMGENSAGWVPDIVHANDWQSGLTAAYLHFWNGDRSGPGGRPRTAFTIHNIQYQGLFAPSVVDEVGLPREALHIDGLEYYGYASFLKAGLYYSDMVTTVSPTYAREIQTPEFGMGMEGLLTARADRLHGILNGIDKTVWDPEHDPWITHAFSSRKLAPKGLDKTDLQREMGLPVDKNVPLFAMVTRLTEQKGVDLVIGALPALLGVGAQVVVLGTGDAATEETLRRMSDAYPNLKVRIGYYEGLAHLITAGADFFLMPSRFEPCGLTQMYALRYGTLPLVRKTGGLADSVVDIDDAAHGTGFVFEGLSPEALFAAAERALALYQDKTALRRARRRAMAQDFGWESASIAYKCLYERMLEEDRPQTH